MAPVKTDTTTLDRDDTDVAEPTVTGDARPLSDTADDVATSEASGMAETLIDELIAFARDHRNDLAIRLLELNALHVEGDITDDEFAEQRAELYAA